MALTVLTHDAAYAHGPGDRDNPERPERLDAARKGVEAYQGTVLWDAPVPLARDRLMEVHTPGLVRAVETACDTGDTLDWDTYTSEGSWDAALLAAGAAVQAANLAADGQAGFSLMRPPGHHATPDRAMGFCLFNNVALAAHDLTRSGLQVAVVDIDVHHGNGTQDIFYDRDDVLFVSLHQSPLYPGTGLVHEVGLEAGRGYTVNLPVPPGTGHEGWLELFERVVEPVVTGFGPDVVLVSAGFDAHRLDPLGGLALTAETFHEAVTRLRAIQPNIAAVLEGGYSLEALTVGCHAVAAALVGSPCPVEERPEPGVRPWGMLKSGVQTALADRWGLTKTW